MNARLRTRLPARLAAASALLLTACATTSLPPPSAPPYNLFGATQSALAAGHPGTARQLLDGLESTRLSPVQRAHYQLLRGRIAMAEGDAASALKALPQHPGNPGTAAAVLKLRANALFTLHRAIPATEALVARAPLLVSDKARQANADMIWHGLTGMRLGPKQLKGLFTMSKTVRGWIELAALAQHGATLQQYTAWQSEFPHHPAESHLADLTMTANSAVTATAHGQQTVQLPPVGQGPAALLLPLSGTLSSAASAVRDGFEAALAHAGRPAPLVYDISTGALSVSQVVAQALSAGAGLIVGPLRKAKVSAVNGLGAQPVPVIALNYLAPGTPATPTLLQFGLSPNDEARQAVVNAARHGLYRAVALVPEGQRGTAVLDALQHRLSALGGTLVASQQYPSNTSNFSDMVRDLLDIDASKARDKAVANALGRWPKFETRRRQDIDFIFISGTPTDDRMMSATFSYWHANRVPIYATADVNTGQGNHDLAGVRFCGMPWKLDSSAAWDTARQRLLAGVNGNIQLEPLYALGLDAGRLAMRLRGAGLQPGELLSGYTGRLGISAHGIVERHLSCAKVTLKLPEMLSDTPPPPLPGPVANAVTTMAPPPTRPGATFDAGASAPSAFGYGSTASPATTQPSAPPGMAAPPSVSRPSPPIMAPSPPLPPRPAAAQR